MDKIDHIAIQTDSIKKSINWYKTMFDCEVEFEDSTWALIKFENTKLALVIPDQHPPHIAIKRLKIKYFIQNLSSWFKILCITLNNK